ncbi:alpha/beta fold hydrolase [Rhizobium halophytocola]|uniref:Pimeloyl-ACP methyl ester carboxylesterase n=1 Tax=Rhizobium halophytocola TaxID=735519 RepID=A0ABS4DTA6_9HYPH|nr:alpha/beta hydrolase [Rhizobium halophytocola]MBP1848902.1 pimeloyl-ACP methyl ester carboxylesterase [Rhizobium halophytocola]
MLLVVLLFTMVMALAIMVALAVLAGAVAAPWRSAQITRRIPNIATRVDIGDGVMINALHMPAGPNADLPPIVFIHGASGNLRDQAGAFLNILHDRADLLFVDRPGHGYSDRGSPENDIPFGQAKAIAATMTSFGIDRAIIVGHSFGGAIAATFAALMPARTAGLVLLAPASHPWPGRVEWYYRLAAHEKYGRFFCKAVALHAGLAILDQATQNVFLPNKRPLDYNVKSAPELVLRPEVFRANAIDVVKLNDYVTKFQPYYSRITAPTMIVTGDSDHIVAEEIHSEGLARDIEGARLIRVKGLGHKPDYKATDLVVATIETIAGKTPDLEKITKQVEARLEKEQR